MYSRQGWLWALLFAFMAGGGWAEPDRSGAGQTDSAVSVKNEGYQFDADRFSRAMDRAAGQPSAEGPTAAAAQGMGGGSFLGVISRTLLSLMVVVGVIYGLTYAMRRFSTQTPFQSSGPLRVLAKQGLSQKSNVYVVAALNRFLIIGETSQGLTCLSEFSDPDEVGDLKKEWGWEPGAAPRSAVSSFSPKAVFAPALKSHIDDLERELRSYEEARR